MKTRISVYDEDFYKKELRKYYDSILSCWLLNNDFVHVSDENLFSFIPFYNTKARKHENFCTWVEIGDVCTSEYLGNTYQFVNLMSCDENAFEINFSQFRYRMSSGKKKSFGFPSFDAEQANYICTIDENVIRPETFFPTHEGEKLFLIYSFPAVTSFGKEKECYLFAHKNISPDELRKHIRFAQLQILKDVLHYPAMNVPGTTIKFEVLDIPNCYPSYEHNCTCDVTVESAKTLFEKEYKERFESLLKEYQ